MSIKVGDFYSPSGLAKMNAVVVRNYARSATKAMRMVDDFPRPMNPAPSEVIVKIHAAGLNEIDISKAKGREKWLLKDTLPYVVGFEFSGVVSRVGAEVTLFGPGDEVYGCKSSALEDEVDKRRRPYGTLAEYCIFDESEVAPKPENLTHEQAASIPFAALTTIQAFETARFKFKNLKKVLILGGGSGLGHMAIQLAKEEYGATHIAIAVPPVQDATMTMLANTFGSAVQIRLLDSDREVEEFKDSKEFDFAMDNMARADWLMDLGLLKDNGICISTNSPPTSKEASGHYEVGFMQRIMMDRKALKYYEAATKAGVEYHRIFPSCSGKLLATVMNPHLRRGNIRPLIDSCQTFEHSGRAVKILSGSRPQGKVVVRVAGPATLQVPGGLEPVHFISRSSAVLSIAGSKKLFRAGEEELSGLSRSILAAPAYEAPRLKDIADFEGVPFPSRMPEAAQHLTTAQLGYIPGKERIPENISTPKSNLKSPKSNLKSPKSNLKSPRSSIKSPKGWKKRAPATDFDTLPVPPSY